MLPIVDRLKESNRFYALILFFLTTMLCLTLVVVRVHFSSTKAFIFLVWNIFLALIPYGISTILVLYNDRIKSHLVVIVAIFGWLVFFPNAPYILTDLFHLKKSPDVPYWYDLALILFFAWNGLMLGYASLIDIQFVLTRRFNALVGWMAAIASLILASFGIYVGRYMRWNSWDIVSSPGGLFMDITEQLVNPTEHPRTYGVTIIFSAFLILGYLLLVQIANTFKTLEK